MITLYTITPRYNHSIFMNILYGHCIYLYYYHSINNDIMTSLFMIILSSAYIYLYYYMTTLCMVILSLDHSISIQYSIFNDAYVFGQDANSGSITKIGKPQASSACGRLPSHLTNPLTYVF